MKKEEEMRCLRISPPPVCIMMILLQFCSLQFVPVKSGSTGGGGGGGEAPPPPLEYHGGPLLTGELNLSLLWYGTFKEVQRRAVQEFVESLNLDRNITYAPRVSAWWNMVESYQTVAHNNNNNNIAPEINVKIVAQNDDSNCSLGTQLTHNSLLKLVVMNQQLPQPQPQPQQNHKNRITVVMVAESASLENSCGQGDKCYLRGTTSTGGSFIAIKNPVAECPNECGWPFHGTGTSLGITVYPPRQDVGADIMVIRLASALAATVTNPFGSGFFWKAGDQQENENEKEKEVDAGSICHLKFGTGAFHGFTGRVRLDPTSGVAFNSHGINNSRFLLPGLWNPATSDCWTLV